MKLRITIDGKVYEAEVEIIEDEENEPVHEPQLAPGSYLPNAIPSSSTESSHSSAGQDDMICRSPINGLVIAVNVEPGQAVEANDLLMVLEAMKMETHVTAARAGSVKNVLVASGASVKVNQTLVEFE